MTKLMDDETFKFFMGHAVAGLCSNLSQKQKDEIFTCNARQEDEDDLEANPIIIAGVALVVANFCCAAIENEDYNRAHGDDPVPVTKRDKEIRKIELELWLDTLKAEREKEQE